MANIDEMNRKRLASWAALLCGVSVFSLATATPVFAQDSDDGTPVTTSDSDEDADEDDVARQDVVRVQGIRSSLQSAQDIKRQAETFVDAVTSEDIGALPDRSVTEALQRVPGITISRFAAADDPDHFSIEGQGVIVRGLTYVRSELNGRDVFSANNGRALSFADVSPELLGSVQVFKNQTADLIEGGLAGTVNLVTRKPFDNAGRTVAGTLEYSYGDFRKKWSPTASILLSDRWMTDIGEFGVLVSGVTSDLKTRSDGSQISYFRARDDLGPETVFFPNGAVARTQSYDRERKGLSGSVQWQNPDKTMIATAEYLRSEATTAWSEYTIEVATDLVRDQGGSGNLPGTEFLLSPDNIFTKGTITANIGWRQDQNDPYESGGRRIPMYGLQSNNQKRDVYQEYLTEDYSFNYKWTPNDQWSFQADYQYVNSTVENTDFTLWGATFQDVTIDLTGGGVPDIIFYAPNTTGFELNGTTYAPYDCSAGDGNSGNCPLYARSAGELADPMFSFWRAAMDHIEDSEGDEQAFRADVEYRFAGSDDGWLDSVRAGVRWSERDQTTRFSTYNWGALSEIWGNGGPVWMDEVGVPEGVVDTYGFDDYQRGEVTNPGVRPFYAPNLATGYDEGVAFAKLARDAWLAAGGVAEATGGSGGWLPLAERDGVIPGTYFLPSEINNTVEETQSAFMMLRFGKDDPFGNGISVDGNIGLRYVKTEFTSDGYIAFPRADQLPVTDGTAPPDGNNQCLEPTDREPDAEPFEPPYYCSLDPSVVAQIEAFSDGSIVAIPYTQSEDHWLPSFNLKIGLNDEMIVRAAYSKGISRPDLGLMRSYFTLSPILSADNPRTIEVEQSPEGYTGGFWGYQATGGNPTLKPVEADNYDLSFEWYFADAGSFTASVFYKEIDNIVVTGFGSSDFTNEAAGITESNVYTRQPTNANETGKVKGIEFAYQQFYDFLPAPLDGLGVQAALTLLDSDGVQSGNVSATASTGTSDDALIDLGDLPLQGLSDTTYNVAFIYEKGPVSARLAYNWRSDYLVTPRDVIVPFYPIFQEDSGQLDGSFFWTVNDNLKIGVQGANLLDTVTKTTSLIPDSGPAPGAQDDLQGGRSWYRNDRRITLSARFKF